ncbi:c-type cytochrome biogenesis protein CcmI [Duganella sp. FT92W]|uniref:C-type cytochrome biogenesis protein CcmI n=1 Tax=Pseudoduganella rivuli TaxID=2666085 RepID=A0A7X2IS10_9BURK|nr:c-type cytochrome biogenesis protein CcmI [Pseudoduganella rivuli]MRV74423.1 c-type cytochrome biogenesis protein CcmI [Pseudoduganella rivuli]
MTWFFVAAIAMALLALITVAAPLARASGTSGVSSRWARWRSALPVAVVPPLLAVGLYAALGNPAALLPEQQAVEEAAPPQVEAMVARLAARLKEQPRDAEGWRMLARSYETLRRFDQAAGAYRQLVALEGDNADLLADYAVVLGMAQGQHLSGEPEKLLERALALNPQHTQVLALLGSAALERNDYDAALRAWKKILSLAPAGSPMARTIEDSIKRVEAQAAQR